jgi:hypothetical protein
MQGINRTQLTRPTVTGTLESIDFGSFLDVLGGSKSTGIVRAYAADGQRFEIRLVEGYVVKLEGRAAQADAELFAELMSAPELVFMFRATRHTPEGDTIRDLEQLKVAAAFALMS